VVSVAGLVLSYASRLKYLNRMEMLHYTDLKLTEAAGMATSFLSIDLGKYFLVSLLFALVMIICSKVTERLVKNDVAKWNGKATCKIARYGLALLALIGMMLYHEHSMLTDSTRDPQQRYLYFYTHSDRHVLFQFVQHTQSNTSAEEIKSSYDELTQQLMEENGSEMHPVTELLPTIVVIMNEAWWNLDNIPESKVSYSVDPMKPLWDLEERCDVGSVSVNIYGGGTISSESEFLLGFNSKYFGSTAGIYGELEKREFPCIVDYFEDLGYYTTAIHPFDKEFYKRELIYHKMGFDRILFDEDMKYKDIFDKYISDESLVNQIIHEYEDVEEEPKFIFAVSMASHGLNLDYGDGKNENYEYNVDVILDESVEMSEEEYGDLVHQVNGIYEANLAYTKLIDYFEKQDEPVIVVMFGDHCPNFTNDMLHSLGIAIDDAQKETFDFLDEDIAKKIYTTPAVVWNNFSEEPFGLDGENINAIPDMLIDYIGLPQTRMTLINKYIRRYIKADTRRRVVTSEGATLSEYSAELNQIINTYLMIQYDILNGDLICGDIWEPLE